MPSEKLYLYEDRIVPLIIQYCTCIRPGTYYRIIVDTAKELRIQFFNKSIPDNGKPGLLIFNFSHGKTTCQIAGNHSYDLHGNEILDFIKRGAVMQAVDFSNKSVTFNNVEQPDFDGLVSLLDEEKNITLTPNTPKANVIASYTITSKYNSSVTITYYTTKTLLLQGSISTLFLKIFIDCKDILPSDVSSLEGSFISLIQLPKKEWINPNLSHHFSDLSKFSGTSCEQFISTSITLLNSDICVSDYSSMIHGIFRAIESIIGKKISEVAPYSYLPNGKRETLGRDFDNNVTPKVFKSTFTHFNGKPIKSAIEQAYDHYYKHRHETFHADLLIPSNTIVITSKEIAVDLAKESIRLISRIIDTWT